MKPIAWMAGASVGTWLAAAAVAGAGVRRDILLGMLGPLAIACGTWAVMVRAYRVNPQRLTAVMMGAFGVKLVLFGAYVAVMIRSAAVQPVPFVASFTAYFIGLYALEALFLKRLLAERHAR
ncbi:MAG: hypothetical protein IT176_10840 [Acidobacteria bacterium]|nr:hypothetical protein [Acidobacteriota bacterium]